MPRLQGVFVLQALHAGALAQLRQSGAVVGMGV